MTQTAPPQLMANLKKMLQTSTLSAVGGVASSSDDVNNLVVGWYLAKIDEGKADLTLWFQKERGELLQSESKDDKWKDKVTDVLAYSQVTEMLLIECASASLALISEDSLEESSAVSQLAQNNGIKSVLIAALRKLLPLLKSIAGEVSKAVKDAITMIGDILGGEDITKDVLNKLIDKLWSCLDDSKVSGPIKIAVKVAIVAVKYAIIIMFG